MISIEAQTQSSRMANRTDVIRPIKATAERTKTVPLSPILGWALIGGGALVLVSHARSKT